MYKFEIEYLDHDLNVKTGKFDQYNCELYVQNTINIGMEWLKNNVIDNTNLNLYQYCQVNYMLDCLKSFKSYNIDISNFIIKSYMYWRDNINKGNPKSKYIRGPYLNAIWQLTPDDKLHYIPYKLSIINREVEEPKTQQPKVFKYDNIMITNLIPMNVDGITEYYCNVVHDDHNKFYPVSYIRKLYPNIRFSY